MKIIFKFAFIVLAACVIAMGGGKANAESCDTACYSCMQGCGAAEGGCMSNCGGNIGGNSCWDSCINNFQECKFQCYKL